MAGTVVIGGGAAGIAAARTLHDRGAEVLLVEAAGQLGGRARSFAIDDATVDLGCGWLHSARRNPWVTIARASGFTIDHDTAPWDEQWRDLGYPPAEQRAFGEAWSRWEAAAKAAAGGPDRALGDFVASTDPWRPMLEAISGFVNGAPLDSVSLHDWAAYDDAATDDNWAVREGYGALVASHAAGVPVRLNCAATRVDHRARTIRIETAAGTIEADRVIVAVPTDVLAAGVIAFDPPLPDHRAAAAALPLGVAEKVFLRVDRVDWPANAHLIGDPHRTCTASHRLSPFGWPLIESFFGGACAAALDDAAAATAFAIDELVALLGSDWRARLHPATATGWRHDSLIGGSYSHARVGHANARAVLARAVDERVFFAGEACSASDFSTAHGAYRTGVDAAEAILATPG